MHTLVYKEAQDAICWQGIQFANGEEFNAFMANDVASRLHDEVGKADFSAHLNSLASTGFAQDSLQAILQAEQAEERDWAAGEALAEAWLSREHGVIWPWNMERDKRTPKASLPGADLIGFITQGGETRLLLGEVKSSSENKAPPPQVMTKSDGMARQLETLATDMALLTRLIQWLQPRCRGNSYEPTFNAAFTLLLHSRNKAVAFFGVLVRDTQPNKLDLASRAQHLSGIVKAPANCDLLALYLPCPIASLPEHVKGSAAS